MAVDLKNLVDRISNLTYQELCELIKVLYAKFFDRRGSTSTSRIMPKTIPSPTTEKETTESAEDELPPTIEKKVVEVPKNEPPPTIEKKEPEYDPHIPTSDELDKDDNMDDFEEDDYTEDFSEDDENDEIENDLHIIYAWRWSGNDKHAKIGITTESRLDDRVKKGRTYHPTDNVIPIGVCIEKYPTRKQVREVERRILEESELERVRPDREWVKIDKKFNKMIDKYFN